MTEIRCQHCCGTVGGTAAHLTK